MFQVHEPQIGFDGNRRPATAGGVSFLEGLQQGRIIQEFIDFGQLLWKLTHRLRQQGIPQRQLAVLHFQHKYHLKKGFLRGNDEYRKQGIRPLMVCYLVNNNFQMEALNSFSFC